MRNLSPLSSGFALALLLAPTVWAFQFTPFQTEPEVTIRCGPARGVVLKQVRPDYPAEARANGIEGTVRITMMVGKNGAPEKLGVLSGPPELVNASLDAIRQWQYKPYQLNGKASPVEASVDINYVISTRRPAPRRVKH